MTPTTPQTFKDFDSINRTYSIIYIDPPWRYRVHFDDNNGSRNSNHHYKTMTDQDIIKLPIQKIAAENCALFLWVTNPQLLLLGDIFRTWGFEFKTSAFTWVKEYPNSHKLFCGLGHYTRNGCESIFLGMKGRLPVKSHSVKQVVVAPYTRHSEKPAVFRDLIVQLFGDLPRIELFARTGAPGWDSMGDQLV